MKQDFDYFVQANIKKGFYYFFQFQQTSTTSVTLFQFHKVSAKCFALCFSSKHINVELYFLIKRKKKTKIKKGYLCFYSKEINKYFYSLVLFKQRNITQMF